MSSSERSVWRNPHNSPPTSCSADKKLSVMGMAKVLRLEDESDLATGLLPLPRVLSLMGGKGGAVDPSHQELNGRDLGGR